MFVFGSGLRLSVRGEPRRGANGDGRCLHGTPDDIESLRVPHQRLQQLCDDTGYMLR